jgi:hypothetical protein
LKNKKEFSFFPHFLPFPQFSEGKKNLIERRNRAFYGNSSAIYHSTLTVQFSYQLKQIIIQKKNSGRRIQNEGKWKIFFIPQTMKKSRKEEEKKLEKEMR